MKLSKKILLYFVDWIIFPVLLFCMVVVRAARRWKIKGLRIISQNDPTKYQGVKAYLSLADKNNFFPDQIAKHINAVIILPERCTLKEKAYSRKYVLINETSANKYYPVTAIMLMLYKNKVGDAVFVKTLDQLGEIYDSDLSPLIEYFHENLSKGCFPDY